MEYKIPTITVSTGDKVTDKMKEYSDMILLHLLESIGQAIDSDADEVTACIVQFDTNVPTGIRNVEFKLKKNRWSSFLNSLLKTQIEKENYENAAVVKKICDRLGN